MLFTLVSLAVVASTCGYLTMYEHEYRGGSSKTLYKSTEDFSKISGWNDVVSSVQARGESWELYEHSQYWGRRMVVPNGQSLNVHHNDMYSSARPTCIYSSNPDTAKLIVYEHWRSQGDKKEILTEEEYVGDEWNDRISSVYAEKGNWEIYEHENFEGKREVIFEGQSKDLRDNDKASSIRPDCATYKMTCKLKKVTIIDNGQIQPVSAGTEIIGSQDGGSCSGPATHTLTLTSTDTVEESTSLELSTTNEINWSITTSVEIATKGSPLGVGVDVTAGVSVGTGGSYSITSSKSKSFSKGNDKIVGMGISYTTPGAALIFGAVERFTVSDADVPADMEMECPDGTTQTKRSTVKMNAVTYPSANFWSLNGEFNKEACDRDWSLPRCVSAVRQQYSHATFRMEEIKEAFDACFDEGKGKVGK